MISSFYQTYYQHGKEHALCYKDSCITLCYKDSCITDWLAILIMVSPCK